MATIPEALAMAVRHHQAGQLQQAEQIYREVVRADPEHADAWYYLGAVAHQFGNQEVAIDYLSRAIRLKPDNAAFHNTLAAVYAAVGKLDEAVAGYRRAVQLRPDYAEAYNNLGITLHNQGRFEEAVASYQRALKIKPGYAEVHNNLGVAFAEQGKFDQAAAGYQQALQIRPDYAEAHSNLGNALYAQKKLDEAAACYRRALEIKPNFAETHSNLGNVLKDRSKLDEAAACYRRALQINPHFAEAHNGLGNVFADQRKLDEAAACYRRALQVDPDYAEAHNGLGNVLAKQGKLDDAANCYLKTIALDPTHDLAHLNLAHSKRFTDADRPEIQRIEELLSNRQLSREAQSRMHFALGKMYDDCREWDRAFAHYREANRLVDVHFDERAQADYVDTLIETFSKSFLADRAAQRPSLPAALGRESDLPIFIVGMPRSATSLVEQIIASHPSVYGAGELDEMDEISSAVPSLLKSELPYPRCIPQIDRDCAGQLADRYLARLKELGGGAIRVSDKMPQNFLHLGLIALLLPGARIIHCRRHPLDVCLSCYFHDFRRRIAFAYDLRNLGVYHRLYERIMDHWRAVLPMSMFEADYQELVEDQEEVSRNLIEFCGLPWHPDCLNFHANTRIVESASHWQVRQPIYTRSVNRWKNYEKFLGPLKEALGRPS